MGAFKYKLGFKRDLQPIVFTPEMSSVIADDLSFRSPEYAAFKGKCCQAYNKLRMKGNLLITLFVLMLPAGMPELRERTGEYKPGEDKKGIDYLVDKLSLDFTLEQANEKFQYELENCKNDVRRQIDNCCHLCKHG